MDISHRHLRAFVSVARHGNFTRASAALKIPQPTLTAAIKQLEAAAGLQLFERTTRRVTLTQAGQAFLAKAEAAVAGYDSALDELRNIADGTQRLRAHRQRSVIRRSGSAESTEGVLRGLPGRGRSHS